MSQSSAQEPIDEMSTSTAWRQRYGQGSAQCARRHTSMPRLHVDENGCHAAMPTVARLPQLHIVLPSHITGQTDDLKSVAGARLSAP